MRKQLCSFSNTIFISWSEKKSILATRQGLYEGQKTTVIRLIISRKNMSLGTCVSSTMYLLLCLHEWCFLCFPYILVDKVVVSAILFDQKKLTDQMLYQMHQFCKKRKISNMRNQTQMIKHLTCFRSNEQMSLNSISVYT